MIHMQIDRHLVRHRIRKSLGAHAANSLKKENSVFDKSGYFLLAYFFGFSLFYGMAPSIIGAITFGWYLSLIIEIPARQLYKMRFFSYRLSVAFSTLFVFAILIFGVGSLVPIVLKEGEKLFTLLSNYVGGFELPALLSESTLGKELSNALQGAGGKLLERTAQFGVQLVNAIFRSLPDFTTGLIVFILTAGYFTYTVPSLKQNLWRLFPQSGYPKAFRFLAEVYGDVRHFIAGQILIALFIGVIVGVGLALVGIPYSLFLGFISGITNFIPYLGVIAAAVPAVVLGLSHQGWIGILKVIIVLAAANQIEGWILSPRIQGSRMKLNWFVIILSILLSGAVFGLIGILIAIPLVVFFKKFWIWYVQDAFQKM